MCAPRIQYPGQAPMDADLAHQTIWCTCGAHAGGCAADSPARVFLPVRRVRCAVHNAEHRRPRAHFTQTVLSAGLLDGAQLAPLRPPAHGAHFRRIGRCKSRSQPAAGTDLLCDGCQLHRRGNDHTYRLCLFCTNWRADPYTQWPRERRMVPHACVRHQRVPCVAPWLGARRRHATRICRPCAFGTFVAL